MTKADQSGGRLTKAQRKALTGQTYYWSSASGVTWANPPGRESFRVRNDVFEHLQNRGLVAFTEKDGGVHYYEITDAGRRALTQEAPND